jgi:branched-chain amino acid transport system substrate-binding protein
MRTELARGRTCLAVVALLALAACGGSGDGGRGSGQSVASSGPVKIGAPLPLTGRVGAFGIQERNASQLVVDTINAAGGIKELGGAKVELDIADTQSDPVRAGTLVRQMAGKGISAFIGPAVSGEVIANLPLIQSSRVPLFTISLDDRATEQNAGYVFRVIQRASGWTPQLMALLDQQVKSGSAITKIGIVADTTTPGPAVGDELEKLAEDRGWQVTRINYAESSSQDFAPVIKQLASAGVQYVTGEQAAGTGIAFAKALAAQTWRPQYGFGWIAGDHILPSFLPAAGDTAKNWVAVTYAGEPSGGQYPEQTKQLAAQYKQKFGQPLSSTAAVMAAATTTAIDAIAKAGSRDPEKVAAGARQLSFDSPADSPYPYFSTGGGVKFDANQDNSNWVATIIQYPSGAAVFPPAAAASMLAWPTG